MALFLEVREVLALQRVLVALSYGKTVSHVDEELLNGVVTRYLEDVVDADAITGKLRTRHNKQRKATDVATDVDDQCHECVYDETLLVDLTMSEGRIWQVNHRRGTRWIYFIEDVEKHLVKIGRTGNLKLRFTDLCRQAKCELRLLAAVAESNEVNEHRLHRYFAKIRHVGEWFRHTPMLQQYIKELKVRHIG